MKFLNLLGLAISSYYFTKWMNKTQNLHLLFSDKKLTKIFRLMSIKFLENIPKTFLLTGHIQTFLLEILNKLSRFLKKFFKIFSFKYNREIFKLSDGACIAIDHAISTEDFNVNNSSKNNINNKILLIVPGITSDSEELYIKAFIEDFYCDFNCVVINGRGIGGIKLYNEKMICSDLYHDLWEYLNFLCEKNPEKKIFTIGFSYGGHILTRCLGEYSEFIPKNLYSGCGICFPTDVEKTENFLDKNYGIYNRGIVNNVRRVFFENIENIFDEKNCKKRILKKKEELINNMKNAKKMRDYSTNYLVYALGYKNSEEYYAVSNLKLSIPKINIPFLSWFTEDDPIVPISTVPFEAFQNNPNTVTIVSEHGGHLGFLSGAFIPKRILKEPLMNFMKLVEILRDYN